MKASPLKKYLFAALKVAVSGGILIYLFYRAAQNDSFAALQHQPKDWGLLALAMATAVTAVSISFVRWWMLARAIDLPFHLRDAFRLGFIGYLMNFFTLGIVGGDLLKAVFLAREQHAKRAEAVATVFIDRAVGLYALFVLASVVFFAGAASSTSASTEMQAIRIACWVAVGGSIVGAVAYLVLCIPGVLEWRGWSVMEHWPRVGHTVERLRVAATIYRDKKFMLLGTLLLSFVIHLLQAFSVYLVAQGLPGEGLTLAAHLIVVPIASLAGALPLPGGIGAFEYALDFLYRGMQGVDIAANQGFVIALGFRVITLLIAMIGVAYYLSARREVDALMEEAKEVEENEEELDAEEPAAAVGEASTAAEQSTT